jgi:hypothetical protein
VLEFNRIFNLAHFNLKHNALCSRQPAKSGLEFSDMLSAFLRMQAAE